MKGWVASDEDFIAATRFDDAAGPAARPLYLKSGGRHL